MAVNRQGSSPLTRGAPVPLSVERVQVGIIPAHAGSTQLAVTGAAECLGSSPLTRGARPSSSIGDSVCRDHPRSRGEHFGLEEATSSSVVYL